MVIKFVGFELGANFSDMSGAGDGHVFNQDWEVCAVFFVPDVPDE